MLKSRIVGDPCFDTYMDLHMQDGKNIRIFQTIVKNGVYGVNRPILILLHGAGCSAHTWTLFIHECKKIFENGTEIFSYDNIGHGCSSKADQDDFSLENMTEILKMVVDAILYGRKDCMKRLILIGHSMGGAISINFANIAKPTPFGLVVLDIVEGTSINRLSVMKTFLSKRPDCFQTLNEAIEWNLSNEIMTNRDSAQITVPYLFEKCDDGYYWIHDWKLTCRFWERWLKNLSKNFLKCNANKLLIITKKNLLDQDLTIAHMQGKFQLEILDNCSHLVHEDNPASLANKIKSYWTRYSSTSML